MCLNYFFAVLFTVWSFTGLSFIPSSSSILEVILSDSSPRLFISDSSVDTSSSNFLMCVLISSSCELLVELSVAIASCLFWSLVMVAVRISLRLSWVSCCWCTEDSGVLFTGTSGAAAGTSSALNKLFVSSQLSALSVTMSSWDVISKENSSLFLEESVLTTSPGEIFSVSVSKCRLSEDISDGTVSVCLDIVSSCRWDSSQIIIGVSSLEVSFSSSNEKSISSLPISSSLSVIIRRSSSWFAVGAIVNGLIKQYINTVSQFLFYCKDFDIFHLKNTKCLLYSLSIILTYVKNMDFSKAGEMMKLQQEAMKVKKELENTLIEAEVDGLVITVNGEMKVEKSEFEVNTLIQGLSATQKKSLEDAITNAVNKGMKKAQEVAGEKMQGVMKWMGLGDMMGWLPGMPK